MHIEAITRWTSARGCCLHILWSNHWFSAGYFPPSLTLHTSHTQCWQLIYVLHWRTAEERSSRVSPPHTHTHKGFQLFNIIGLQNLNYTNMPMDEKKQGANSGCLWMWDDKEYILTLSDLPFFSLKVPNTEYQTTFVLRASCRGERLFFFTSSVSFQKE